MNHFKELFSPQTNNNKENENTLATNIVTFQDIYKDWVDKTQPQQNSNIKEFVHKEVPPFVHPIPENADTDKLYQQLVDFLTHKKEVISKLYSNKIYKFCVLVAGFLRMPIHKILERTIHVDKDVRNLFKELDTFKDAVYKLLDIQQNTETYRGILNDMLEKIQKGDSMQRIIIAELMSWLELPEVIGVQTINPEIYANIKEVFAQIKIHSPNFADMPNELYFINSDDETLVTLFAKLVALRWSQSVTNINQSNLLVIGMQSLQYNTSLVINNIYRNYRFDKQKNKIVKIGTSTREWNTPTYSGLPD